MSCRRHQQAIDRLFLGDLPAAAQRTLRVHLAGCDGCRARYDLLSQVNRARLASGAPLHADQLAALQDQILERAAPRPARAPPEGVLALALGSLATAGLVIAVSAGPPDEYQARGAARTGSGVALRAFCISGSGAGAVVVGSAGPGQTLRCRVGEAVQFAVSAPSPVEVAILGQAPDGTVLDYHAPQEGPPLGPSEGFVPLPRSNRITAEHPRGVTRIVAAVALPATGADRAAGAHLRGELGAGARDGGAQQGAAQIQELRLEVVDD